MIKQKKQPSIKKQNIRTKKPFKPVSKNDMRKGVFRVKHKEQISKFMSGFNSDPNEIFSSFTPICPGNSATFPWLSSIALHYDSYKIISLEFEYIPTCPTITPGAICIAYDVDTKDSTPTALESLQQCMYSQTGPVYTKLGFKVDPKDLFKKKLFTSTTESQVGIQNTFDRTSDAGSFIWGIQGTTTRQGYLVCTYEFEFSNAQNYSNPTGTSMATTTVLNNQLFNNGTTMGHGSIGTTISTTANEMWVKGERYVLVNLFFQGTGFTGAGNAILSTSNASMNYIGEVIESTTKRTQTYYSNKNFDASSQKLIFTPLLLGAAPIITAIEFVVAPFKGF